MEVGSFGALLDYILKTYGATGTVIVVLLWFIKYLLDKNETLNNKVIDLSAALAKVFSDSTAAITRLTDGLLRGKGGSE